MATPTPSHGHPYYPLDALLPDYVPNESPVLHHLPIVGPVVLVVLGVAYWAAGTATDTMAFPIRPIDRFASAWFALCGLLHVAFEGYYIYHRETITTMNSLFAQLWKEYSLSDSRYLTLDTFTVSVESITVFIWGPLSWLTVAAIVTGSPKRHLYQTIVCVAHLYGVALYYLTNWTEYHASGVSYSRPEFLYFWVYYVGFNLPWAVVPLYLLHDSSRQIVKAFEALKVQSRHQKTQ